MYRRASTCLSSRCYWIQVFLWLIAMPCTPMSASASFLAGLALTVSTLQYVVPFFGPGSLEHGAVAGGGVDGSTWYEYVEPSDFGVSPGPSLRGATTPEPCPDPLGSLDGWRFYLAVLVVDPSPTLLVLMAVGGLLYGAFWFYVGWRWGHHPAPDRRRAQPRRIEDSAPARVSTAGHLRR